MDVGTQDQLLWMYCYVGTFTSSSMTCSILWPCLQAPV